MARFVVGVVSSKCVSLVVRVPRELPNPLNYHTPVGPSPLPIKQSGCRVRTENTNSVWQRGSGDRARKTCFHTRARHMDQDKSKEIYQNNTRRTRSIFLFGLLSILFRTFHSVAAATKHARATYKHIWPTARHFHYEARRRRPRNTKRRRRTSTLCPDKSFWPTRADPSRGRETAELFDTAVRGRCIRRSMDRLIKLTPRQTRVRNFSGSPYRGRWRRSTLFTSPLCRGNQTRRRYVLQTL